MCTTGPHTTQTHCVGVEWYLHSVAIACAVIQFAWFGCVYHWTTHNTNPLRRCRVVLTLCSDCVCGDPVRLVWLCVPLDHTQHKPHCVGVEWYLHSVAIACAVIQFAWFGCVYHWTTHNTNPPLRRCRVVLTLCSDCVCGDPVRLVWLCVPLDHTQHKPIA